jgi:hypothetical protein
MDPEKTPSFRSPGGPILRYLPVAGSTEVMRMHPIIAF